MTAQPRPSALVQPLDETPPLRHRIHEQLERLITTGSLAPGTRLVESELAQTLGVSSEKITPVGVIPAASTVRLSAWAITTAVVPCARSSSASRVPSVVNEV